MLLKLVCRFVKYFLQYLQTINQSYLLAKNLGYILIIKYVQRPTKKSKFLTKIK